jgi:GNAT superfamily N-acetyltransferase
MEDDRAGFDCGRPSLNTWFQRHAWRNQVTNASRTNVIIDEETGAIIGYVSLCAGQISRASLSKAAQRNAPDPIPVILLGQLAVDQRYQGQGHARSLLLFALETSLRLSREIGCLGVITHPLDEDVRAFYARFGFEDLPYDPKRSMIVRMVDLAASGFGA